MKTRCLLVGLGSSTTRGTDDLNMEIGSYLTSYLLRIICCVSTLAIVTSGQDEWIHGTNNGTRGKRFVSSGHAFEIFKDIPSSSQVELARSHQTHATSSLCKHKHTYICKDILKNTYSVFGVN